MTPKEKDDFFKVEVRFGEVHPWFFDTTEPKELRVEEAFYLLMSLREFAEECERADAKRARSDSAWDIYRTDRLTEDEIHNAASTALVHVPVLTGPVDPSAPVVVASEMM